MTVKDEEDGGASLLLDGKPMRTPGKAAFTLPVRALAEAVASEWRAQGEHIDPSTMPLTRLANSAIDGVAGREQAVIDDIARHAASDLLCYRVQRVEHQAKTALLMSEGDELRTMLAVLRRYMKYTPANTVAARRRIADSIIEAGKYNL